MRVVRSAGENVSPSDDGRLFAQIFDDGLFTDATFTALGTNNVQISPVYGDLCGRDFTIEQMTVQVELPEGEGTETGVIYIEIDTSSDDVITVNSALDPFTPTYEDINTNGAVAQMVIAEYSATSLGVSSVTAAYTKLIKAGNVLQNLATVESGSTASQNYAVGDYVCVGGILYKVTAAIASGQSFTVGTNIEQTNVGTELSSLNSNNVYQLHDSKTGLNNAITLPADFNELIVKVLQNDKNGGFTFYFCKELLTNSSVVYRNGYDANYGANVINLRISLTSIYIEAYMFDGASQTTCETSVYYR